QQPVHQGFERQARADQQQGEAQRERRDLRAVQAKPPESIAREQGKQSNACKRCNQANRKIGQLFEEQTAQSMRNPRPRDELPEAHTDLAQRQGGALGLRQIAQRIHYRHATDQPGRDSHREKGKDNAQAVGEQQAARLKAQLERKVKAREDGSQERDQRGPYAHADQQANEGGQQIVERALEEIHQHQVTALHPDRARHAHLGPPLRRQQAKDQKDQQQADRQGKERKEREDARENIIRRLRSLDALLLHLNYMNDIARNP